MAQIDVSFPSASLGRTVTFSALVPVDRGFRPGQKTEFDRGPLRTLYMLNGYTGDRHDYLMMTDIWRNSLEHGLAIIFPSGENSFYLEDNDLGTSHSRFVGEELVEFTRALFPLSSRREDTFIGGISMGAYGALINGLRYPQTFSRILTISGAHIAMDIADARTTLPDGISSDVFQRRIFGDPSQLRHTDRDPRHIIEILQKNGAQIPQIWQCCGSEDFLINVNRKLHDFLVERQVEHHYEEGSGTHDWAYWLPRLSASIGWMVR